MMLWERGHPPPEIERRAVHSSPAKSTLTTVSEPSASRQQHARKRRVISSYSRASIAVLPSAGLWGHWHASSWAPSDDTRVWRDLSAAPKRDVDITSAEAQRVSRARASSGAYLHGGEEAGVTFGEPLPGAFTLFTVARYEPGVGSGARLFAADADPNWGRRRVKREVTGLPSNRLTSTARSADARGASAMVLRGRQQGGKDRQDSLKVSFSNLVTFSKYKLHLKTLQICVKF